MSSDTEKIVIKYSSYTEAQKKATKKYRTDNKEKVNEQRKKYYQTRKEKDPDFLTYKRDKAKEYYSKKKSKSGTDTETESTPKTNDTHTQENVEIPKKKICKVRIKKTDIQKKAIKKVKQLFKDLFITEDDLFKYQTLIDSNQHIKISWVDNKGKSKSVEYFTINDIKPKTPEPETDIDTTDTENIILGDEHILEDLKPESMKTPEKPILKRIPKTPKKVKSLTLDI
jgi:hypothetical protein